jgi:hypothetical protein
MSMLLSQKDAEACFRVKIRIFAYGQAMLKDDEEVG